MMKHKSKEKELKYYGFYACLALWKKRPHDIIRVYIEQSHVKACKDLLKWCAEKKKAYHIIPNNELDKVSDSVHHEGICILAKELPNLTSQDLLAALEKRQGKICLLYLDGVQNPHNVGSIIRSCAHFGIDFILGEKDKLPNLSPSAVRIAKGGAEEVRLVMLQKPLETLSLLKKKGFSFIGTSSHEGGSIYKFRFSPKAILAMGSESHGMGKDISALLTDKIQIPGSGRVESLNVSVATSLCLGEYYRQQGQA